MTAAACRIQEAIQAERALNDPLENVRAIALRAAKAWGVEAAALESREARRGKPALAQAAI
ncbi:MAG: hypothetical protein ACKOPQ_05005 [Novosphingobium sp.]